MPDSLRTIADYTAMLRNLLPRGPIWRAEPGTVMAAVLGAIAAPFSRVDDRAKELLVDAFPATTEELLPEWEATLGLPDACSLGGGTVEERQQAVAARLVASGGQSQDYFATVAAVFGAAIAFTEYRPFGVGSMINQPLWGERWANVVTVTLPTGTSPSVECLIRRYAPAHVIVGVRYGVVFPRPGTAVLTDGNMQITDQSGAVLTT